MSNYLQTYLKRKYKLSESIDISLRAALFDIDYKLYMDQLDKDYKLACKRLDELDDLKKIKIDEKDYKVFILKKGDQSSNFNNKKGFFINVNDYLDNGKEIFKKLIKEKERGKKNGKRN